MAGSVYTCRAKSVTGLADVEVEIVYTVQTRLGIGTYVGEHDMRLSKEQAHCFIRSMYSIIAVAPPWHGLGIVDTNRHEHPRCMLVQGTGFLPSLKVCTVEGTAVFMYDMFVHTFWLCRGPWPMPVPRRPPAPSPTAVPSESTPPHHHTKGCTCTGVKAGMHTCMSRSNARLTLYERKPTVGTCRYIWIMFSGENASSVSAVD